MSKIQRMVSFITVPPDGSMISNTEGSTSSTMTVSAHAVVSVIIRLIKVVTVSPRAATGGVDFDKLIVGTGISIGTNDSSYIGTQDPQQS